jgi:uncharacterized Zn finger protein (UPF0148 family)
MIYTCDKCHFIFKRTGKVESCPDCGKEAVREATDKEKEEYKRNRDEYEQIEKQKMG